MKKILSFFLFASVFFTAMSCGFLDGSEPYITDALEGTWQWQRTTGGFAGITIDADSVDYTRRLVIHENAKAYLYKTNEIIRVFTIKFEDHEWLEEATYVFYPENGSPVTSYVAKLDNNELVLVDNCDDCYIQYFTRK